MNQKEKTLVKH